MGTSKEETESYLTKYRPSIPIEIGMPDTALSAAVSIADDHPLLRELSSALPDVGAATIKAVLQALPTACKKGMLSSETVELPGLLSFAVKRVPATKGRQGINPFTKEVMTAPGEPERLELRLASLLDERFRELDDDDVLDEIIVMRPRRKKGRRGGD